jgi:hypothetical protein
LYRGSVRGKNLGLYSVPWSLVCPGLKNSFEIKHITTEVVMLSPLFFSKSNAHHFYIKVFFNVKKSNIGCEMSWICVYKIEIIPILQAGFVGLNYVQNSIIRWYQSLIHDPLGRLLLGFWSGPSTIYIRVPSPIALGASEYVKKSHIDC